MFIRVTLPLLELWLTSRIDFYDVIRVVITIVLLLIMLYFCVELTNEGNTMIASVIKKKQDL